MKQNLASYKMPREVVFLDELPRNATGKVLKRELREAECRSSALARSAKFGPEVEAAPHERVWRLHDQ